MKIRQQLVSSRAKTWGEGSACTSITVHETANTSRGANAAAHANLQSRGNVRQASWHYQVDDKEIVQSFLDTVKCWHAGSSAGAANSIAIEICVNSDGDYEKALANAAWLVRHLREKHGLGREDVKQHHHWTGKNCPTKLRASGRWSEFRAATDPQEDDMPISRADADLIVDRFLARRIEHTEGQKAATGRTKPYTVERMLTDAGAGGFRAWKDLPALRAELAATRAALVALAKNTAAVDPKQVERIIESAVQEALSDISITLTAGD